MIDATATGVRAIHVERAPRPAYVRLEIPQDVDPGPAGDYASVRIYDDRGRETPYVLDPSMPATRPRAAAMEDLGYVDGRYTEAVFDAGTSGERYDAIALQSPAAALFNRVEAAISDDRHSWRIARADGLIYRLDREESGTQTIAIGPARARWIRIRIFGGERVPLDGATVGTAPMAGTQLRRLQCSSSVSHRDASTTIAFDCGVPRVGVRVVRFEGLQREFSRDVVVEASDDALAWRRAGEGHISRYAYGAARLAVATGDPGARYWRAVVADRDDPPIAGLRADLYGPTHALVFEARPFRSYAIAWGAAPDAPQYDLGEVLAHDPPRTFARATAGEQREAPRARAKGTRSNLLTAAVCAMLLLLGGATFVALRPPRG